METTILSVALGLGLAAACGFRIFVPFLVMNLAARGGWLEFTGNFEWMSSTPALIVFAVATGLEIGAYYIPWLDNLLDTIATPTAVVAGIVATASVVTGMDPMLKWTVAAIAGGSVAGVVQATTGLTRQASLWSTGGLANPLVSTTEAAGAAAMSVIAIAIPLVALVLVLAMAILLFRRLSRRSAARADQVPVA